MALDGQSAVLHCRSDRRSGSVDIGWSREHINGSWETIATHGSGCSLQPRLSSVYSVISDNEGQCDLVVNRTDTSSIGHYTCYDGKEYVNVYLAVIGQLFSVLLDVFTDLSYENIN